MNVDLKAFDQLSYGLYLISSGDGEKTAGCVINTLTQAAVEPVLATVTIHKENETARLIRRTGKFAAVVLAQSAPMELIGLFGFRSSREVDKFDRYPVQTDAGGIPYVCEHVTAVMSFRVWDAMDAETHWVFLGEATEARQLSDAAPMTYAYYHEVKRGLAPPKAPSYRPKD